jgi:hypothetical protein
MKKKKRGLVQKLADRGLVGSWPPIWVPFFLAVMFFIFALFAEKLGFSWGKRLNLVGWFSIVWGIVHWYVNVKLKRI